MVNDICEYVIANPVPWQMESFYPEKIASQCKSRSLISVYQTLYETYAAQQQAGIWCCKSMANLNYIPQIEQEGLSPIYVHLVRDGRDVAASFKKTIVGERHIYHLAKQWVEEQHISEKFCHQLATERYVLILYEDLIHDTENTLCILCHKLGLTFSESALRFYQGIQAKLTAE